MTSQPKVKSHNDPVNVMRKNAQFVFDIRSYKSTIMPKQNEMRLDDKYTTPINLYSYEMDKLDAKAVTKFIYLSAT
jgi:hypothetical protein